MNKNTSNLHFLCVSIPSQFIANLLTASAASPISLDSCNNIGEAYEKISTYQYEIFFIDGSLSEDVLSSLIDWIFKNSKKKVTIALLEGQEHIKNLEHKIDFFFQKGQFDQQLASFFKEISLEYPTPISTPPSQPSETKKETRLERLKRPVLFFILDDENFLDLLDRVKEQFPLDIHFESNPEEAIKKLQSLDFTPDAVIISQQFTNSNLTAFDLLDSQSDTNGPDSALFILVMDEDNTDLRMKAIHKKFDYIFTKPISSFVILNSLKNLLEIKGQKSFKVLIADKNESFCHFALQALNEVNLSSKEINEPDELFKTIAEFKPDLLLLSSDFENQLNFLKAIRQDVLLQNLIVVIVSENSESYFELNAYLSQVSAIFYKPIERILLQTRVLNLLKGNSAMHYLPQPYDYTGFDHRNALVTRVHHWLMDPKKHGSFLVLFEIDRLADWVKRKGGATAIKNIVIKISNQLQKEFDYPTDCFFYDASKFAILVADSHLDDIEKNIYQFLSRFVKGEKESDLSFNCCLIPLSIEYDAQEIIKEAEKELIEASQLPPSPIKMIDWLAKEKTKNKKCVFVVDPDKGIAAALSTAFESHGILLRSFSEGEEVLKELDKLPDNQLPSLVIIERKLPDMDGMDLFMKIKFRYHSRIPCFILTVFSSDKDLRDGLSHGVSDYFVKPFNISLFVQKALKAIYPT